MTTTSGLRLRNTCTKRPIDLSVRPTLSFFLLPLRPYEQAAASHSHRRGRSVSVGYDGKGPAQTLHARQHGAEWARGHRYSGQRPPRPVALGPPDAAGGRVCRIAAPEREEDEIPRRRLYKPQ